MLSPGLSGRYFSGLLIAFGGILGFVGCAEAPQPRMNVIVVSADTLERPALRVYNPDAPALQRVDAFANNAVVYADAYTTAPWTLPSHVSLFTGLYPGHHGITRLEQRTTANRPTMASILRGSGYRTIAFTDGALLDSSHGHAAGFQRYDEEVLDATMQPDLVLPRDGARSPTSGQNLFDRGIAFLDQNQQSKTPFFMFLHTFAVHDYFYQFANLVEHLPASERRNSFIECLVGEITCSDSQWEHLRKRYDAGIQVFDEAFGQLLDAVDRAGLRDSTIIVLLSDHGEGFDPEGGRIHHGGRVHQDQIRIPFVARIPGVQSQTIHRQVSLIDVLPTLLDVLSIEVLEEVLPEPFDGESVADWLYDEPAQPRALYAAEYAYLWKHGKREYEPGDRPQSLAVIQDGWWYLDGPDGEELYSMADDPAQHRNQAATEESIERFRRLAADAAAWKGPDADRAPMDEELLEHLRSLGYIQ